MKVAIIGYGFVGKALENGFKENVETILIDPKLNTEIFDLKLFNPNLIFICVPTPMNNNGSQDISIIEKIFSEIIELQISGLIVLKSTVLPKNLSNIEKIIPEIVYNPEFLREKFANEDFINSPLIIFGGNDKSSRYLSDFYLKYTKCITSNHKFTDLISASLIKYSINSFLATKVIFFNELFKVFTKSNPNDTWENFIKILMTDERIGSSHLQVPGPDGRLGFGGACFPKDTNALYSYSLDINEPFNILYDVIKINNEIRNSYDSLNAREKEQNINYDFNPRDIKEIKK